jgi:hypothetical protein
MRCSLGEIREAGSRPGNFGPLSRHATWKNVDCKMSETSDPSVDSVKRKTATRAIEQRVQRNRKTGWSGRLRKRCVFGVIPLGWVGNPCSSKGCMDRLNRGTNDTIPEVLRVFSPCDALRNTALRMPYLRRLEPSVCFKEKAAKGYEYPAPLLV